MGRPESAVGEVTYNGFTFPGPFSCTIRSVPIYDSANRARKYIQYTITIECIVVPDDPPTSTPGVQTDTNLANIRKRLQSPYKPLTFEDQGFGPITVDGLTVVDSLFGPKPRMLSWEPVGSNRACRVLWQCEVTIPECSSGTARYTNALAELTFQSSWNINEDGMTERTTRGTIEVPISIKDGIARDTIDNYRETFNPPQLPNFWRSRHYDESRGKNVMEISIIDVEVPSDNPLWPGSVKADVRHTLTSDFDNDAYVVWHNTLQGSIRAVPGYSRIALWNWFLILYQQRRTKFGNNPINLQGMGESANVTPFTIVDNISVTESIFDRDLDFSISWSIYNVSIENFLEKSGMFLPIEGTSWQLWKTELSKYTGPRGNANLKTNQNDDLIIDLCTTESVSLLANPTISVRTENYTVFTNKCEKPGRYLKFCPSFDIVNSYQTAIHHKRYETTESAVKATSLNTDPNASLSSYSNSDNPIVSPSEEAKLQVLGPVKTRIVFYGYAERLCEYPALPKVVSFCGEPVTVVKESHTFYIKKTSDSVPEYGVCWRTEFDTLKLFAGDIKANTQYSGKPENFVGGRSG
jgi:hypothetical protein